MLLAAGLIAALLLGFVLGRIWEIRQRIMVTERADERPLGLESDVTVQIPEPQPRDESELVAAFDREMKELVRVIAAKGRNLHQSLESRA